MLLDALRKHQCNPDTSCVVDIPANMDDEDESNDEPSTSTTAIHDTADVQPRKHSLKLITDVHSLKFYILHASTMCSAKRINHSCFSREQVCQPYSNWWTVACCSKTLHSFETISGCNWFYAGWKVPHLRRHLSIHNYLDWRPSRECATTTLAITILLE